MNCVVTGTGDELDLPAGAAAVFGFTTFGNHAEFADGLGIVAGEGEAEARHYGIVGVDAVERGVVAALALAIDVGEAGAIGRIVGDAGLEGGEGDGRAAKLRERIDIAHGDAGAALGIGCLDDFIAGGDADGFGGHAHLEFDDLVDDGGGIEFEAADDFGSEAGGFDGEGIGAGLEGGEGEEPLG